MKLDFLWSKGFILKNEYCLKDTNYISSEDEVINQLRWCQKNTPGIIWIRTTDTKNKNLKTDLDFFAENINLINENTILITGDGDRDVPSSYQNETVTSILNNKFIKSWYTQNLDLTNSSDKFKYYPIGINFHHKQIEMKQKPITIKDNLVYVSLNKQLSNAPKKLRIFCDSHLNITHPARSEMFNKIKDNKNIDFLDTRVDFTAIHELYSSYHFILSPRGNGVDCYRTWEAFLLGAIVITLSSPLDKMYIDNRLPVVILQDWNQLNCDNLKEKLLEWLDIHKEKTLLKNIIPKFSLNYWIKN